MRSIPAKRSWRYCFGVNPDPLHAFSALAMTRSSASSAINLGTTARTASMPGCPTMSPIKRIFMRIANFKFQISNCRKIHVCSICNLKSAIGLLGLLLDLDALALLLGEFSLGAGFGAGDVLLVGGA